MTTDIYVISLVILHWTVVLTVGIAAFIIMLMKGPAYVADAYPLEEAATPDKRRE
jgi:cytochrome b561